MEKIIILFLLFGLFSCSENNSDLNADESKLEITVSQVNDSISIDREAQFKVTCDKPFNAINIEYAESNELKSVFISSAVHFSEYKTEHILCQTFDRKFDTIKIIAEINNQQIKSESKQINIETFKDEGFKIKSIEFLSFENQVVHYETENTNGHEKYKFFQFYISKGVEKCNTFPIQRIYYDNWYFSKTIERGNNYYWDLTEEHILINHEFHLFSITPYYVDNNQNIVQEPGYYYETYNSDYFYAEPIGINFQSYIDDEPEYVEIERSDLNLKIRFEVEW